jgi:hypothetical protein
MGGIYIATVVQNPTNMAIEDMKTIYCNVAPIAAVVVAIEADVAGLTVAASTVVETPLPLGFGITGSKTKPSQDRTYLHGTHDRCCRCRIGKRRCTSHRRRR